MTATNLRMTERRNNVPVHSNTNHHPTVTIVVYGLNDTDFSTEPLSTVFLSEEAAWDFVHRYLENKRVWKMVTV